MRKGFTLIEMIVVLVILATVTHLAVREMSHIKNGRMRDIAESQFKEIKDSIFENSQELSEYYKKISGKHISSHTVFENGLRETVFENGICVYVNYTDKTITSPAGEVAPYDYLVTEK
jgi:prepilin-type N-terminal cleavage/methylation domain-containing protein